MSVTRIYLPTTIRVGQLITIQDQAFHHLIRVLRMRSGETFHLFNDIDQGDFLARIQDLNKHTLTAEILDFFPKCTESPLYIHLAQGIAKGEKMDFVIQKAVELGVQEITPIMCERVNVRIEVARKRDQHWQHVLQHACEQSGRVKLPILNPPQYLIDWLPKSNAGLKVILSPKAGNGDTVLPATDVLLLVGPEGGFTDQEVDTATTHGFLGMRLGPRILRTETAGMAAMAIFQAKFGDLAEKGMA